MLKLIPTSCKLFTVGLVRSKIVIKPRTTCLVALTKEVLYIEEKSKVREVKVSTLVVVTKTIAYRQKELGSRNLRQIFTHTNPLLVESFPFVICCGFAAAIFFCPQNPLIFSDPTTNQIIINYLEEDG